MNIHSLIMIGLFSVSLYISKEQLKEMKKQKSNVLKHEMKLNKVDCGCGCSEIDPAKKNSCYDYTQNDVLNE